MFHGDPPPPSWNLAAPSAPWAPTGNTIRPSGSGAFEAIECRAPFFSTHRIGEPSGYGLAGSSNVVPTTRNFSSALSAAIVATRFGLSRRFTVYPSGRGVRV